MLQTAVKKGGEDGKSSSQRSREMAEQPQVSFGLFPLFVLPQEINHQLILITVH